ncbi:MAG: hypothetical protein HOC93_00140 [Phycisphaerae bacterium]|nr:hypothetical protein [Phycisphaerae bacterium]
MSKKAVVLLSGGLDSATVLAIANSQGYTCHALSFHYGQRHDGEIKCSQKVAKSLGTESHVVTTIDLSTWGGSALTGDIDVPKDGCSDGIPVTYVPARNTIFLSHALGYAEAACVQKQSLIRNKNLHHLVPDVILSRSCS